jgi:C4-dicarboxylate-specific signal transduction histidine kinase
MALIAKLSIRILILFVVGLIFVPMFGLLAYLYVEIFEISSLTQYQNSAVATQHALLTRQAELSRIQDRVYRQKAELLAAITRADTRLQALKNIQLEFSRLERASFTVALSRRVNQYQAMLKQREVFVHSLESTTEYWPALTAQLNAEYLHYTTTMDEVSVKLGKRNKRPGVKQYLEAVKPVAESLNARLEKLLNLMSEQQAERVRSVGTTIGQLAAAAKEIEVSGERVKTSGSMVASFATTVADRMALLKKLAIAAVLLLAVIGPGLSIWLANYISGPLKLLLQAMNRMSKGDLNQKVEIRSKNEIGHLGEGFNTMAAQLQRTRAELLEQERERKEASAQIIQASKLATLGEMATSVAHELNQPLNVIRMAAGNGRRKISNGTADPQYLTDKLQRIEEQTARAAVIIDHMRMFGRKAKENPEPVDPREVVTNALSLVGEQLRLAGIEIVTELPQDYPSVLGHTIQMEQVVLNLLTNARDALAGRDGEAKITVRVFEDDKGVHVTSEDTGGGIPDDVLPRIFEPFYTTKEMGKGTGLGLSVSYGIIRDMNGTIVAENIDGGARFTVTLPSVS